MTPDQLLRKFEDEHIGEDAPRQDGKIERGHGSLFQRLSDELKAMHGALENLVHAHAAHMQADANAKAAKQKLDEAAERAGVDPNDLEHEEPEPKEPEAPEQTELEPAPEPEAPDSIPEPRGRKRFDA